MRLKCIKARVWSPSVSIPAPHSYPPHEEERHLLLDLSSPLPKPFNDFLSHLSICSLLLTCLAVNGIPTSTSLNFAQVTKVSFGSQLFPTSGFCSCCFLCLECVSFCFSHDQVFLILQILTDMWFPQQSLPGPYYWKSISPFILLCIPLHSLFLLSFVIICSFGCLLFRYSTIQTMGAGLVSVLSPLSLQCPVESEAGDRWVQGWAARVCSLWTVALWQR